MIQYQSTKQISIDDFIQPFGGRLDKKNRWIILATVLPSCFPRTFILSAVTPCFY